MYTEECIDCAIVEQRLGVVLDIMHGDGFYCQGDLIIIEIFGLYGQETGLKLRTWEWTSSSWEDG